MRWDIIVSALSKVIPAYFSNLIPPLSRGKRPVDLGKKIRGKRILGDGKTVEGIITGILGGILGSSLSNFLNLFHFSLEVTFLMSSASLIGDMFGSFIKRRIGMNRGDSLPIVDQIGFVVFGILVTWNSIQYRFIDVLIILTITPALHLISNWIGFLIGVKKEPW